MTEKYGKEREVSFIDNKVALWLAEEAPEDGLCLARFHADIEMEGVAGWQPGQTVETADGQKCEITKVGKRCFAECGLLQRTGKKCPLADGVAFGKKIKKIPSMDAWLAEAKQHESSKNIGMYLTHNGVVRETAKAKVREGKEDTYPVTAMEFSYDAAKLDAAVEDTYKMPGIYYIRTWLAEGRLDVGDDIMYVLIGGDIRPHIVDALQYLVGRIKDECVIETEIF